MNFSLSVNNFRKFKSLQSLNCNDITFLVGPNGSGKSSFTKALLLEISNFNNIIESEFLDVDENSLPLFRFNSIEYGDMHIDRFSRALFNCADEEQIILSLSTYGKDGNTNTYKMTIEKSGTRKDTAVITGIDICSRYIGRVELSIDYANKVSTISIFDENENILFNKKEDMPEPKLQAALATTSTVPWETIGKVMGIATIATLNAIPMFGAFTGGFFQGLGTMSKSKNKSKNKRSNLKIEANNNLHDDNIKPALLTLSQIQIDYVYAHYVEQNYLFIQHAKDFLSNTVIDFFSLERMDSGEIKAFIQTWMDTDHFNIGEDFRIREGEIRGSYYFDIIDNERVIPLADKGVGQIQIMILLMRIGIAKMKYEKRKKLAQDIGVEVDSPLIIIEEPEQNMHPNMQSKLADLFKDAHYRFNISFLIETHSEYLIRRSQVLVSQMYANNPQGFITDNPFKVIYFPENGQPYDMQFRQNGFFVKTFKPGFIDEAGKWQMELLTNNYAE